MYRLFHVSYGTVLITAVLSLAVLLPSHTKMTGDICAQLLKREESSTQSLRPLKKELFREIFNAEGVLSLAALELAEKMPDLKREFVSISYNGRPDAGSCRYQVKLSSGEVRAVSPGEKIFLRAKREGKAFSYHFSDAPGSLWVQCAPALHGSSVEVQVFFLDSAGKRVTTPSDRMKFSLPTTGDSTGIAWEINGDRVDASFGVKQQMRRLGKDLFLVVHGGAEYAVPAAKERFDFRASKGERYSQYLAQGDWLFWDGDKWVPRGLFMGDSTKAPLLEVKRLEEKTAVFDIWNVGGTVKQSITLLRYQTSAMEVSEAIRELSFVGMKSWSTAIVVFQDDVATRTVVRPDDWFIRRECGWVKLSSPEDVEEYVVGGLEGPLLVVEGIVKEDAGFVLKGHLFNSNRTVLENIAIPMKRESLPSEEYSRGASLQVKDTVSVEKSGENER
ncbi:hypothetical protein [Chlamydiifrater phoenicopteri]|uniref:hypothetical protein n=1 Tax=Chlamydiifrater phoenicopteri TaxID=2681469 RepID=UPI001BCD67EE|nr:hypothetical protein [Chlamydiifrater phoenicopteri]